MEIGQFSKITALSVDTLRYYNRLGLIVPNRVNNRRTYEEIDFEKAQAIIKLKAAGFSLVEIKQIFDLDAALEEVTVLSQESKAQIRQCLKLIEFKYQAIIEREKEQKQIKESLEKMINKTNQLLNMDKMPVFSHQGGPK